jgi:hypothetical protein
MFWVADPLAFPGQCLGCQNPGSEHMRYLRLITIVITAILMSGCSQAPLLILFNNTSSDVGMIWGGKEIIVRSHSEHRLPDQPTLDDNSMACSAILVRVKHRYGYTVNPENLFGLKARKNYGFEIKYNLILNEDGNIYLSDPEKGKHVILSKQPQGFPIKGFLID